MIVTNQKDWPPKSAQSLTAVRIQLEFGHFTKLSVAATVDCQNTLTVAYEAMRKAKYSSPVLATLNMSQT